MLPGVMRALASLVLVFALVATVAEGHAHAAADDHGPERCAVCVLRSVDAAPSAAPGTAPPADREAGEVAAPAGPPPVCGAPLGAIPGQSPPASA